MDKFTRCVQCDQPLVDVVKEIDGWDFGGWKYVADLPMKRCESGCGGGYLDGATLMRFEHSIALALVDAESVNGAMFVFMRKSFGMGRALLAETLEVEEAALEAAERRKAEPMPSAWVEQLKHAIRECVTERNPFALRRVEVSRSPAEVRT